MQNKRGIAQALSPKDESALELRRATVFDVFSVQELLSRPLCSIAQTLDKTLSESSLPDLSAQAIRKWLQEDKIILLATLGSESIGLGVASPAGEITALLAIADDRSGSSGAILLARLEDELVQAGCRIAYTWCAASALEFFENHGWTNTGPSVIELTRLEKVLRPLP